MNESPEDESRKVRGGVVLEDKIYCAWCDICDDELGDFATPHDAYQSLDYHVREYHRPKQ